MKFKNAYFILFLIILFAAFPAFAVAAPRAVRNASQYIAVSGTGGSNAIFTMYEKDEETDEWQEILSANAYIGKAGFGKMREGDMKTPVGVYHFTKAFGILEDPGCQIEYTQVDEDDYWCGDSNSPYYNQFVSIKDIKDIKDKDKNDFNKNDSEHIIDYEPAYNYALNISYNEDGTPNRGSAIFLHCQIKNKFTAGCVAIPENVMRDVMIRVKSDCVIIMDVAKNINKY